MKWLYISETNKQVGCTPEENYDPRYYDLPYVSCYEDQENYNELLAYIEANFSGDYCLVAFDEVLFTENYDLQEFMQEETFCSPVWFDVCSGEKSVADELHEAGFVW